MKQRFKLLVFASWFWLLAVTVRGYYVPPGSGGSTAETDPIWSATALASNNGASLTNLNVATGIPSTNGFYYVWNHGITTNAADNTTALTNLLAIAFTNGGGTIVFGVGTYRFTNCIEIPYTPTTGGNPAYNKPFRLTGAGGFFSGQSQAPNGGTILNLSGTNMSGKIVSRGLGTLEIDHLTLQQTNGVGWTTNAGGVSVPLVKTIFTTLLIHHAGFYGPSQGTNGRQDAIEFGGDGTETAATLFKTGGDQSGFQGYGTVIRDNYFNRIRTAVKWNAHANALIVRDNCLWSECGGNRGAFEMWSTNGVIAGNSISGNLVEISGYTNAFVLGNYASSTMLQGNNFYDPDPAWTPTAYVFSNGATANIIIGGYIDNAITRTAGANSNLQTFINQGVDEVSVYPHKQSFPNAVAPTYSGSGGEVWRYNWNSTNLWKQYIGNDKLYWRLESAGTGTKAGTNNHMILEQTSTNVALLSIGQENNASSQGWLKGFGQLYVVSGSTSKELWLGDSSNQRFYIINGVMYCTVTGRRLGFPAGGIVGWSGTSTAGDAQAGGIMFSNGVVSIVGASASLLTNLQANIITVPARGGFASTATNRTISVAATGITNTLTVNYWLKGFTGTSVVQTNAAGFGFSRGTVTAPTDIILQPGEFINGSSCAAMAQGAF